MDKRKIRLLVLDVDGTLTDGKIYMGASGEMMKAFDIKDGCGIHDLLPTACVDWSACRLKHPNSVPLQGIIPIIITARTSKILENRCRELNIQYLYQGCRDKAAKLRVVAETFGCIPDNNGIFDEIAYMGDDIIDLPIMRLCGIKACPSDAAPEVRKISDFVARHSGGNGAVREFIEWLTAPETV
jgi:3-deoxy-D-manno-octulosonate 8-phosphate phosphatase (KDO 8-P phosphatase)